MQRLRSILKWSGIGVAVTVVVLLVLYAVATRTDPGLTFVADLIGRMSTGQVTIRGLRGDLPNKVEADYVELRDTDGVWLTAEKVSLDWDFFSLVRGPITVNGLQAQRVAFLRLPKPSNKESSETQIDVGRFHVSQFAVGPGFTPVRTYRADGSLHYLSIHNLRIALNAQRLDGQGTYRVDAALQNDVLTGSMNVEERAVSAFSTLLGLPNLGDVRFQLEARASGTTNAIAFAARAGKLTASGQGTIDLAKRWADVAFKADAPAMQPAPGVGWRQVLAHGAFRGTFDRPDIEAELRLVQLRASGLGATLVTGELRASGGSGVFDGHAHEVMIPGSHPRFLAAAPVDVEARIDFANGGVTFALRHPVLVATGSANMRGPFAASAQLSVPSLRAFAPLTGVDLAGTAELRMSVAQNGDRTRIGLDGRVSSSSQSTVGRMIGPNATVSASATVARGQSPDVQARVDATGFAGSVTSGRGRDVLDYRFDATLKNLALLAPSLVGSAHLNGAVSGKPAALRVAGSGTAGVGARGMRPEQVVLSFEASGLPSKPFGHVQMSGRLLGAPLSLAADIAPAAASAFRIELTRADWKSLRANGAFVAGGRGGAVTGKTTARIGRLQDFAELTGLSADGSVEAVVGSTNGKSFDVTVRSDALRQGSIAVRGFTLGGTVADALSVPRLALKAHAAQVQLPNVQAGLDATIDGPLSAVHLGVAVNGSAAGAPFTARGDATADIAKKRITLASLAGNWRGKPFALTRPAAITLAPEIAVDRLEATFAGAHLAVSGQLAPKLAVTGAADNVTPDLIRLFAPQLNAVGAFSAHAQLAGTLAAPTGTFDLSGNGIRTTAISASALPPGTLAAHGTLHGTGATFTASFTAGAAAHATFDGDIPLKPGAAMRVHGAGAADLSVANAYTAASGQTVTGKVTFDGSVTGTTAAPRVSGNVRLAGGSFHDFAHSLTLKDIQGELVGDGTLLRVVNLTAKAQQGTIAGSGSIDVGAPGMPVSIAIKANNAEPIVSDRITARFNSDLSLTGKLSEHTVLAGTLTLVSGEIVLPEKFPPAIKTLNVRRPGQAVKQEKPVASTMGLNLTLSVPDHVNVRGRGLEAQLYGDLKIAGTANEPVVMGALTLRRGTLSIVGQTLDIQSGKLSFDGNSLRYRLDPTVDFSASTTSGGVTATVRITGYVSAPVIALSSSPTLPQDEVLAHLLFQSSTKQLSAVQLAQLAQAVGSFTGIGGGFDPINGIRKSLGLDRLAVGSATTASGASGGTTLEAGRYVAEGLYVGAKQNFSGGTKAIVQYDLTRNIKLQATVNTGTNSATAPPSTDAEDNGSSVGITYTFDY